MAYAKDLSGMKYGHFIVLYRSPNRGTRTMWHCRCDCGTEKDVWASNLVRGLSMSCGCVAKAKNKERMTKHCKSTTRLYRVYSNIKTRCFDPNSSAYPNYGGRGIKLCDEWLGKDGFQRFWDWSYANGYDENAPKGKCTIDRINNDGDYSPQNCRWITLDEQARNKRNNYYVSFFGEKVTLSELSRMSGIDHSIIRYRYEHGMRDADLLKPMRKDGKYGSI